MEHASPREIVSLGDPSLQIAGLRLWVHGRQFPEAMDYWDGNWLRATAYCEYPGASVWVRGSILHLGELVSLREDCERLYATLQGTAKLDCIEPNLNVTLTMERFGKLQVRIEITPDELVQTHAFLDSLDQTYLPGIVRQCDAIFETLPIREVEARRNTVDKR